MKKTIKNTLDYIFIFLIISFIVKHIFSLHLVSFNNEYYNKNDLLILNKINKTNIHKDDIIITDKFEMVKIILANNSDSPKYIDNYYLREQEYLVFNKKGYTLIFRNEIEAKVIYKLWPIN